MKPYVFSLIRGMLLGLFVSLSIGGAIVAHGAYEANARLKETASIRQAPSNVNLPAGRPVIGQAAIEFAMRAFAIKMDSDSITGPFYDSSLEDRGMTLRRGLASPAVVMIGREAFASWGLLGSTLAHEIEVHCRQNFLAIHLQNLAGFDGTGAAEREAYRYELVNAERFGLGHYDRELIRSTMTYFYPEQENNLARRFVPVRAWLDRMSASSGKKGAF
jgi:hypothetical protein